MNTCACTQAFVTNQRTVLLLVSSKGIACINFMQILAFELHVSSFVNRKRGGQCMATVAKHLTAVYIPALKRYVESLKSVYLRIHLCASCLKPIFLRRMVDNGNVVSQGKGL